MNAQLNQEAETPDYIVVEGPIGVGKTTLANKLARSFGSDLLLEGATENPFLEKFYENPKAAALPTQLFFLFQRAQQLKEMKQEDMFSPVRVADFLVEKDRLFAELTLDAQFVRAGLFQFNHRYAAAGPCCLPASTG